MCVGWGTPWPHVYSEHEHRWIEVLLPFSLLPAMLQYSVDVAHVLHEFHVGQV